MIKAYKYRIYPTHRQRKLLQGQLDACRWLYNHFLEERKTVYEATGKGISCYDQINSLPALKQTHPELALVHSQVLQNVAVRLDLAFKAFFQRLKQKAEKPGFPRFKGFWRYDSITFPQLTMPVCVIEGDRLRVAKVGQIKIVEHRPMKGVPKTATLTRSSTGKWYVCFSCENVPPQDEPETGRAVGIDVGLKSVRRVTRFCILSPGE
ncbi:MAG TPA: transposase [Chloroflexia bacterium]|nr:transposase [Chloroflexia bacterium]